MARDELVGGPLDGRTIPAHTGGIRWVDDEGRAHAKPGPGRWPYLRGRRQQRAFAGHGFHLCSGCGAYIRERTASCPLCGKEG